MGCTHRQRCALATLLLLLLHHLVQLGSNPGSCFVDALPAGAQLASSCTRGAMWGVRVSMDEYWQRLVRG